MMPITPPVAGQEISATSWGIPITNEVNRLGVDLPRGLVAYRAMATDNQNHTPAFEWGVSLDLTVPAATGRRYRYEFALALIATATPVYPGTAGAYVWYSCNVTDKNGAELARWIIPTPQWDGSFNFCGSAVITPSPGTTIGAGIYFGSGTWTMRAGSNAALYDVGKV